MCAIFKSVKRLSMYGVKMSTRTTIKDIARATGVSASTVSLVLNGKDQRISEKTRRHVVQVANELEYEPNQLAVGLITQRSHTLGLIIPDVSNTFFSEIAKGAEEEAFSAGYNIILCNTNDQASRDVKYMNLLLGRNVDGIALTISSPQQGTENKACQKLLELSQKPAVLIDRIRMGDKTSSIMVDHLHGGFLATKHLIDQGHRKIGCITGSMRLYTASLRFQGYKKALEQSGIPLNMDWVEHGHYHLEDGERLAERLMRRGVTAIFACNDLMAYGVYRVAKRLGVSIPDDLSVVGFDNLLFSDLVDPPLTTVAQGANEIGTRAIRKLIALVENRDEQNESIRFEPYLVTRKSVKERSYS